jgi:hypothetical protein
LAKQSGKRIQFEVEEHTLCGNEIAPPRVVFTSDRIRVSAFFDETLPYSTRMRLRRLDEGDDKGEIDVKHAQQPTPSGETLEEFDPEEEVLVRSVRLNNNMTFDGIEDAAALYPAGLYKATVRRANTVNYLDIELNINIDEEDAPERSVLGAFFIGTTPNNEEVATIVEDTERIAEKRSATDGVNRQVILNELSTHGAADNADSDQDDEDFLGGEEEEESDEDSDTQSSEGDGSEMVSMPISQLANMLAAL